MGGINDIKGQMIGVLPSGSSLKAVRMRYDNEAGHQVFEMDIVEPTGPRTIWFRSKPDASVEEITGQALAQLQGNQMGLMQMPDIGPDPRQYDLEDAIKTVEHKGEKYELAHDGAPKALFF